MNNSFFLIFKFSGICGADGKQIMLFFFDAAYFSYSFFSDEPATGPNITGEIIF